MINLFWSVILGSVALVAGVSAIGFVALFAKETIKQLKK